MELVSTNPMDHPLLDPKYLSHKDDVKTFIKGNAVKCFETRIIV